MLPPTPPPRRDSNAATRYAAGGLALGVVALLGAAWTGSPPLLGLAALLSVATTAAGRVAGRRQDALAQRLWEAEGRLRRRALERQILLQAIPDPIYHLRRDGIFLDYHALDDRALFALPDAFMGRSVADVFPADAASALLQGLSAALDRGEPQQVSYTLREGAVPHIYEARLVPCADDQALVLVRDQTEHRATGWFKEAFTAALDHELRPPITAARGALRLLREGRAGPLNAEMAQLVEIADLNGAQLEQLVHDVHALERMSNGKVRYAMQQTDLVEAARAALRGMEGVSARRRIRLHLHTPARGMSMYGDPERLTQLLQHLISTVIRSTPEGGEVSLRLSTVEGWLRVELYGSGFSGPVALRLQEASDLGLALARRIAERHSGRVGLLSTRAGDSVLCCSLPSSAPPSEAMP